MPAAGVVADITTYNSALAACSAASQMGPALALFAEMKAAAAATTGSANGPATDIAATAAVRATAARAGDQKYHSPLAASCRELWCSAQTHFPVSCNPASTCHGAYGIVSPSLNAPCSMNVGDG